MTEQMMATKKPAAVSLIQLDQSLANQMQEKIILEDSDSSLENTDELQLDDSASISPSPEDNELLVQDLEN